MPLQKKIIQIDTSKYMKIIDADMNVKIKVDSSNFLYGVNGGRGLYKFQIKWLNKQRKALIGDITTIINILRLESDYEKVNVIDVNIEKINMLTQDLI